MKIIISQHGKKLLVSFKHNNAVDRYVIDKADDFLICVDKFLTRYYTGSIGDLKNVKLEFKDTGILTERIIRAIVKGLEF
ncbi:MAG: hypothetical protein HYW79_01770 [Parcubacteria group bacterium]|nr:hypothetical protein [Parcubacteria group bacterium]